MRAVTPSPELRILRLLASRPPASAAEIATAMALPPAQARTFLLVLETLRLVHGRQDPDSRAPRRVFTIMAEGRRKAEVGDARHNGST